MVWPPCHPPRLSTYQGTTLPGDKLIVTKNSENSNRIRHNFDESIISVTDQLLYLTCGGTEKILDLTDLIVALESFQNFAPALRRFAIALYATELGISEIHFYTIAAHADLVGGVR